MRVNGGKNVSCLPRVFYKGKSLQDWDSTPEAEWDAAASAVSDGSAHVTVHCREGAVGPTVEDEIHAEDYGSEDRTIQGIKFSPEQMSSAVIELRISVDREILKNNADLDSLVSFCVLCVGVCALVPSILRALVSDTACLAGDCSRTYSRRRSA